MRRAALALLLLLVGCQALLVFDDKEPTVVVVTEERDGGASAAAGDGGASGDVLDAPLPSALGVGSDPCAPPERATLVYCDRFDDPDGGHQWTSESVANATFEIDSNLSAPSPDGSLHVAAAQDLGWATIEYVFSAIKPTKLRVEFDFSLQSFAHTMAIAYIRFGTYYVRIMVNDESFFGYDQYDDTKPGSDFGLNVGVSTAGSEWSHVALEVITSENAIEHAKLTVNGPLVAEGALTPSDSTTSSLSVVIGTADKTAADMHFDNVRITRSP